MFRNRIAAGQRLATELERWRGREALVLALPRGGVPVAAEVATHLGAELGVVLVRKIGLPTDPELAMGAVVDAEPPIIARNEAIIRDAGISPSVFTAAVAREQARNAERRRLYLGARSLPEVAGRPTILVDDGIATGATVTAALQVIRRLGPSRLVLATPVAPESIRSALKTLADEVICLAWIRNFRAVGDYYDDFLEVSDSEVVACLGRLSPGGSSR